MTRPSAESTPVSLPTAARIQIEAAARLGFSAELLDPVYGYVFEIARGAQRRVLYGGRSPLNDAVAARIAEDKYYTELVLRRAGLRVPESVRCLSPRDFRTARWPQQCGHEPAGQLAAEAGFPLVVKPNRLSHGRGVTLARDERELAGALGEVWDCDYCALAQRPVAGIDLRLDVLDGELLVGYTRAPVVVVGDGRSTLRELLAAQDPRFADPAFRLLRQQDELWRRLVVDRGWTEETILPAGGELGFETGILNLNRWAKAALVTELSPEWLDLCSQIATAMQLRHLGIDFKIPHVSAAPDEATIIEVNNSPLLAQLYETGHQELVIAAQVKVLAAFLENSE